ncbi:hypothetical protein AUJ65_04375 [Candidatus Micrarchaeota archaeon CG1_02_51_15]|nr:MAG: hypothetical protein AUJ65_04375 [Candidatus Micrarchaeota archaeon CG1_02_51_15]
MGSRASVGTSADIKAGVRISRVHSGYFSNARNAELFCKIGIDPILTNLPKKITVFDFGGGEGFLTKRVKEHLASKGYDVNASVLDANAVYLKIAKSAGLQTILSSIQDSKVSSADLIIARAVIHYNSAERQQAVFNKIFESLKKGGYFVHQVSSGSKENCCLRSDILNIKSLGRAAARSEYNWLSEEDCLSMAKKAGFKENFVAGYALANSWSPREQWDRFNKKATDEAKSAGNRTLLDRIEWRKAAYLKEANRLVEEYAAKHGINGIKKTGEHAYRIEYTYPIFICRK